MKRALISALFLATLVTYAAPAGVHAQLTGANTGGTTLSPGANTGPSNSGGQTLINPLGTTSLEALLLKILQIVIRIGSIVIILMIVYVGFLFVTARGEPGKLTTARQALLWTVIGALVLLGAQAIALGIQATVSAISGS